MEPESISEKRIQRALSVSRVNGWSVAGFAGLCTLAVLLMGDLVGFGIGLAVSAAGCMELRGHCLLKAGKRSAFSWLAGSQLYLMGLLWGYAIYQLMRFDPDDVWSLFSPEFKDLILAINPDVYIVEALIRITYPVTYYALMLAVLFYQGGLCLYYLSRKKYLYPGQE